MQEVYLGLRTSALGKVPPSQEDILRWESLMKAVLKAEHERLFIVMTAQSKGWQFAKELDFYQSGIKFLAMLKLTCACPKIVTFF